MLKKPFVYASLSVTKSKDRFSPLGGFESCIFACLAFLKWNRVVYRIREREKEKHEGDRLSER